MAVVDDARQKTKPEEKETSLGIGYNMNQQLKVFEKPSLDKNVFCHNSKEVRDYMTCYSKADREIFVLIFLNARNIVIDEEVHSVGDVDSSAVYPRQVFRSALINNATSIICVHNHPAGGATPSHGDKDITKQLVRGGKLLGIRILDHVIVTDDGYYSFADRGLIEEYERTLF